MCERPIFKCSSRHQLANIWITMGGLVFSEILPAVKVIRLVVGRMLAFNEGLN